MPGEGFFKTYFRLHPQIRLPKTDHEKMKLYLDELNRVLTHYCCLHTALARSEPDYE